MPRRNIHLLLLSAIVGLVCFERADSAQRRRFGLMTDAILETFDQIDKHYVEPIDRRRLFEGAMSGVMSQLDDYSAYYGTQEFDELQENLEQEFGGIGIQLSLDRETRKLTVLATLVGTPAYDAGMLAGDVITRIDGTDTEGFTLEDAVKHLRGEVGEPVRVTVIHEGDEDETTFEIVRDVIQTETVLGDVRMADGEWDFRLAERPDLGYVRISSFSERTIEELTTAIEKLAMQGVEGLILDLRNNPGGLLSGAVSVVDMFIDGGLVVTTRGRDGVQLAEHHATEGNTLTDLPVVVLVNRYSASASEIVAAALQDHERAVVIGERTWGKGSVQNIIALEGGRSALKLTTASYWRPSGKNIHRLKDAGEEDEWGVYPDAGYRLRLDDESFEEMMVKRRDRDVAPPRPSHTIPEEEDVFRDSQLKRAIEFLDGAHGDPTQAGA